MRVPLALDAKFRDITDPGRKDDMSDVPDDYDWMSIFPRWFVEFAEWLGLADRTT